MICSASSISSSSLSIFSLSSSISSEASASAVSPPMKSSMSWLLSKPLKVTLPLSSPSITISICLSPFVAVKTPSSTVVSHPFSRAKETTSKSHWKGSISSSGTEALLTPFLNRYQFSSSDILVQFSEDSSTVSLIKSFITAAAFACDDSYSSFHAPRTDSSISLALAASTPSQ